MSTDIEWVRNSDGSKGKTWNPIIGCSKLSAGCRECYAVGFAYRHGHNPKLPQYQGVATSPTTWSGVTRMVEHALAEPLKWRKPQHVFVGSMTDLFHDATPFMWIDRVFAAMAMCPQHTFQLLTKRPERMLAYFNARTEGDPWAEAADEIADLAGIEDHPFVLEPSHIPLSNVWLGVTVENQEAANERIPLLLATPAAVRFISVEPLLSRLDLSEWLYDRRRESLFGTGGSGLVYGQERRDNLEKCNIPWRRGVASNVDLSSESGAQQIEEGWLSSRDVQRLRETQMCGCPPSHMDGSEPTRYSTYAGDQSRTSGWQQATQPSRQSNPDDTGAECDACDKGSEAEAESTTRRGQRNGKGDGTTGVGDQGTRCGEVTSSTRDRDTLWFNAECSIGHSDRKELASISWVIAGAETGPKKRPMDPAWALNLRDQCINAGVPFFFKKGSDGKRELDGKVWEQFPTTRKAVAA